MYIYCIHLFLSLFIIPSQSVFDKSFAKPLANAFRKTSIIVFYILTDATQSAGKLDKPLK